MKTYFNALCFLLASLNTVHFFAQKSNFSGEVRYSVSTEVLYNTMVERFEKNPNSFNLDIFSYITKTASNFECKLSFNNQKSEFGLVNAMSLGNQDKLLILAIRAVTQGIYFTNLITGKQILKDNSSTDLYIESSLNTINWQLTKEIKKIGDYICYKAIAFKEIENIGKVAVTVWYTPEIPIALGPKDYVGNLPGLVLEYKDHIVHFIAKKVVLNPKKEIVINWPEGKTISKEDYQKQQTISFSTLKENSGR